jgi:hypothetical protein
MRLERKGHPAHRDLAPPHVEVFSNTCFHVPESSATSDRHAGILDISFDSMVTAAIA